MITLSGLGSDFTMTSDTPTATSTSFRSSLLQRIQATAQATATGDCQSPDVMSEFGCLTPMVAMPGSSSWNTILGCPPNSTPYNAAYCLRTGAAPSPTRGGVATDTRAADTAVQTAADAQAAADAAAKAQAAADAAAAAQAADAHAKQEYADAVAAAAAIAAQTAIDAYIIAHGGDGTQPSPGMTVTPVDPAQMDPAQTQMYVPASFRWGKWAAIGAGVIGAGMIAALLLRR